MGAQVAQLERQLAASKEAMEADIRAKVVDADALKGVVDELRNATCHTIAGSEAAILALQVRSAAPPPESHTSRLPAAHFAARPTAIHASIHASEKHTLLSALGCLASQAFKQRFLHSAFCTRQVSCSQASMWEAHGRRQRSQRRLVC